MISIPGNEAETDSQGKNRRPDNLCGLLLHFIPMPPPPEGQARDFMTALFVSHHLYVTGALQVAGGLCCS